MVLGVNGTGAASGDALPPQADSDFVGVGVGAPDVTGRDRVLDLDIRYDPAFLVVQAAQKRPRPEQAAETAIGESRKSVSYG
jgi:hypothetical protein